MDTHSTDIASVVTDEAAAVRHMTTEQFRALGMEQVVYVRRCRHEGRHLFMLFGADGEIVVAVESIEAAIEIAAERDLAFATVN